ncbi:hypothetical protein ACLOJK_027114, partial [Asimina triloba]
ICREEGARMRVVKLLSERMGNDGGCPMEKMRTARKKTEAVMIEDEGARRQDGLQSRRI